jgi:filamentous hemagglutinin family protein
MKPRTGNFKNFFWLVKTSILLLFNSSVVLAHVTMAQVIPDKSLNSQVTQQGNVLTIEGGSRSGGNLFHSFEKFSVPTGTTLHFNNATDVQNIITRVTGGTGSNVDGLIQANSTANLFLINPSGIIFGPNALLQIGGSFLSSTANSLRFADGTEFSAKSTQPLLTISIPIGFQIGENSGSIQVQGNSSLVGQKVLLSPLTRGITPPGLLVQPGKTLALVGKGITLNGATLTAENGEIELGSVDSGFVQLVSIDKGWTLDYKQVPAFKDIQLAGGSLVDASGVHGGSIQIQGANISFQDGSVALIQNVGTLLTENLKVNASKSLNISGTTPNGGIYSVLRTSTVAVEDQNFKNPASFTEQAGFGNAANIIVSTKNLTLQGGSAIGSISNNKADTGNVVVNATDSIKVSGASSFNQYQESNIQTLTSDNPNANGKAGNINLSTLHLTVDKGAFIAASTIGPGKGGNLKIDAKLIELAEAPSYLGTRTFGSGNSGAIEINTEKLIATAGGRVDTSTLASGSAGTVVINAKTIELSGSGQATGITYPSSISSSATIVPPLTQKIFGLPAIPDGKAGDVKITANMLNISNGGEVSVKDDGPNAPGTLQIQAESLKLDSASITAAAASKEGGNIFVNSGNLQMFNNSNITASAGDQGNGGNIKIDADTVAILGGSSVTANAFKGKGGNIIINAQGFFLSPDSQVTATSQEGVAGTVQINVPESGVKPVTQFPDAVRLTQNLIACVGQSGKTAAALINVGTGGIPQTPEDLNITNPGWQEGNQGNTPTPNQSIQKPLGAQSWRDNGDGTVRFVAEPAEVSHDESLCQSQEKTSNE